MCSPQLDIALVIDASGSIRQERFQNVTYFMREVVRNMNIGPQQTHLAAISFSDSAAVEWSLNTYLAKEDILQVTIGSDGIFHGPTIPV